MRMTSLALCVLACVLVFAGPAGAGTIYDNGSPDLAMARVSDFGDGAQLADDFVLGTASTIRDVHWWGIYGSSNTPVATDNFTIRIFADQSGPAVAPLVDIHVGDVGRTDTGQMVMGVDNLYSYSVQVSDIVLIPGNTYWLSIVNNYAGVQDQDDVWHWATSSYPRGTFALRDADGEAWSLNDTAEFAFTLTDDVQNGGIIPEPATLALFGLGALGVAIRKRRKRA